MREHQPTDKQITKPYTERVQHRAPTGVEDAAPATARDPADEQDHARFLTTKEAATYLCVSKSYLDKLRCSGGGPEFLRFGPRKIVYAKSDLDLWARGRRYGSTSEYES